MSSRFDSWSEIHNQVGLSEAKWNDLIQAWLEIHNPGRSGFSSFSGLSSIMGPGILLRLRCALRGLWATLQPVSWLLSVPHFIISATSSAKNGDGNQHIFAPVFVCFCLFPYDWRDFNFSLTRNFSRNIQLLITKSEHFIIHASCSVVSSNQKDKARIHDQLESYFIHR